ncbi:peptidoglycan DD-metalloendopeptidase family protein [Accumulibacter sp.]|uniref:peptidoglycan DD-metalloendopeptidase family protein n=1 Tax=Accumulibacter sp. TaxID=2053492 RepID=UPI0025E11B7F|nr:peptidoglycan DD-metalloendopeptidase family protein [Accumulibacter sp.]MCM8596754.1 peptidoglycan DD-metalloendopeptidase family protein [Accumulibacter sp.]MCM8624712.1 peptidoglycan DD-metalloendopeptidase family protein [Accumulibacter sp.]MDS4050903.1 peptidoglycan DD-metalloendopeptidase family protein [Accumulibacter sp.]
MNDLPRLVARHCRGLTVALVFMLAACASKPPVAERGAGAPAAAGGAAVSGRDIYVVRKGDTLHSIALDQGVDYRELAAWNNIENPNRILVGQQLRIRPPGASATAETAVVRPVSAGAGVEQRPLAGSAGAVVEQRPQAGSAEPVKREPRAGKEPYSEQALARAQAQAKAPEPAAAPAPVAKTEIRSEVRAATRSASPTEPRDEAPADDAAATSEEVVWSWPASGKLIGTFSEGGNKGIDIQGKAGDAVLAAAGGKVVYSGTGLRGYGKLVIVKHNNAYLTAYAHNQNVLVKEGQSVTKGQKIAEMGNTDADQVKLHFEIRRQGKPVDPLKHLPPR